jgi:hypothetical protein
MAIRDDMLLAGITKTDKIIEIGPSFSPPTPKAQGWRSYAVDHVDRDGLINKYRNDPSVNVAKIEQVDFVWAEGPLSDAVPAEHHGTFDVFLACHVLEHIPDLAGLFHSAEVLCRSEAKMVLVLPDKRVCFDFFRPLSTTGDVLAAYWERRSRHSAKTLWDHFAYHATKPGGSAWRHTDQTPLTLIYSPDTAHTCALKHDLDEYTDAHAWTFVPASFSLIMFELACLGLTDWRVERTLAAESTEFYTWLRRGALAKLAQITQADLAAERIRLLNEIMLELDDQGRQLPARPGADLADSLARTQAELAAAHRTLDTIRSSRAWRMRSVLRRLLGLPTTLADA